MTPIDPRFLEAVTGGGGQSPVVRWLKDPRTGQVVVKLFDIVKAQALGIMHYGVMRGPKGSKPKWLPLNIEYRSIPPSSG